VPEHASSRPRVGITVDGAAWSVPAGCSIAAAFMDHDMPGWRRTRQCAELRGMTCGIGVCFDCLVTVDGVRGVRACLADVRPGDVITTDDSAGFLERPAEPADPGSRDVARCDLAVIGAGPAGMTAAVAAAEAGCAVRVLDLAERVGGQYWRWGPASNDGRFHHGWRAFTALRDRFGAHQDSGRIVHLPGHAVFHIEPPDSAGRGGDGRFFRVHAVAGDRRRDLATVQASAVVVATGAYDRQLPIPGWSVPGVMAAGAAQSLLKGSAVAAGRRVAVAGTGPFLLPVAAGLAQAGAQVAAVIEANQPLDYLRRPRDLAASWRKLPEAGGYLAQLARHRVPILRRHAVVAAHGDERLRSVTVARVDAAWHPVPGSLRTLDVDVLAAGYGFVPQVELLGEAGAQLVPGAEAGTLAARAGPDQQTTVPGLFAAGETTGVGGADLARIEGEIAGRAAARYAGRTVPQLGAAVERRRRALRRFSAVMESVHALRPGWIGWQTDETVVCRCEEVTVGRLRAAIGLGADDARSAKLLARPGMGWCQGRICGEAVAAIIAAQGGRIDPTGPDPARPGPATSRPLAQPVPLRVLAALARDSAGPVDPP
jgi:D-hydroxyproline dehydrogenase subunit alpha